VRPLNAIVDEGLASAERLASFQLRLNDLATPAERKEAIISAMCDGFITKDETALLIQSYGLDEA
jgi:hypothetical protein